MGVLRRLVDEEILHDQAFERGERRRHVLRIRVRLREVLALHVQALEAAIERRLEHVRYAQSRVGGERAAAAALEEAAYRGVRAVTVAAELVREGSHVAGALDVVLAAQGIDTYALAAEVAGRHREVRDCHRHGCALTVLGDAEAVVDRRVGGAGIEPSRGAQLAGRHAGDALQRFWSVVRPGNEGLPAMPGFGLTAGEGEVLLREPFRDDDVRDRVHYRDVGAGL